MKPIPSTVAVVRPAAPEEDEDFTDYYGTLWSFRE